MATKLPEGFTGTLPELIAVLEKLEKTFAYGGIQVDNGFTHRPVIVIETVTGGYSEDEDLLGRLQRSPAGRRFWRESRTGGYTKYEIPEAMMQDDQVHEWILAKDAPFEQIPRARTLQVHQRDGSLIEIALPYGASLRFIEDRDADDFDFARPTGVLILEPMEKNEYITDYPDEAPAS